MALLVTIMAFEVAAADTLSPVPAGRVISLGRGKWDTARWMPLRLPHQMKLRNFAQRDESIGVETFTDEEKRNRLDNVLLMTDTGTTEGEFEVIFSLSEQKGAAPGVFLAPLIKDGGVLDTSIAIFVASHTMAVWKTQIDRDTGVGLHFRIIDINRDSRLDIVTSNKKGVYIFEQK